MQVLSYILTSCGQVLVSCSSFCMILVISHCLYFRSNHLQITTHKCKKFHNPLSLVITSCMLHVELLCFRASLTSLYMPACLMQLLIREWPNVFSLLAGLIVIKTLIITAIGPRVGLSLQESIRIGLLLSQGGEFAFVVFSLANRYSFFLIDCHFSSENLALCSVLTLNPFVIGLECYHLNWTSFSLLLLFCLCHWPPFWMK